MLDAPAELFEDRTGACNSSLGAASQAEQLAVAGRGHCAAHGAFDELAAALMHLGCQGDLGLRQHRAHIDHKPIGQIGGEKTKRPMIDCL